MSATTSSDGARVRQGHDLDGLHAPYRAVSADRRSVRSSDEFGHARAVNDALMMEAAA